MNSKNLKRALNAFYTSLFKSQVTRNGKRAVILAVEFKTKGINNWLYVSNIFNFRKLVNVCVEEHLVCLYCCDKKPHIRLYTLGQLSRRRKELGLPIGVGWYAIERFELESEE
jgi:hypothetical protein